ncbi:MAG: FKBP-type peptidyl-prolyl cis-trans isomerase [Myxococcales bacterium]|nr:FKBP-type peptidyl-prolyl cis-trans isomerase [Myxococcales bacterium]
MRSLLLLGFGFMLACNNSSSSSTTSTSSSATAAASASGHASTLPVSPFPNAPPAPADVGAAPADATKTSSGVASKVLTAGTGKDHPGPTDKVKVHYTGWTKDGKVFDSSIGKDPLEFGVGDVITGWTEGLQLMVTGEKRRLWIPAALAYGERPRGGAPAGDLVFDVELLEVKQGPKPPEVPADVKAAPADAKKTASGLAYKVLTKGKGTKHPAATDRVSVHYSGWTPDGKMFDSSVVRGEPTSFGLNQVIPGWTEGVQLMVEGEKTRFWIPSALAYGDTPKRPGAPAGPLVFDIELISIK